MKGLNNMCVFELIKRCRFEEVEKKIVLHYGEDEIDKYKSLYHLLSNIIPKTDCKTTIYINAFLETEEDSIYVNEFSEDDNSLNFDVIACNADEPDIVYSIAADRFSDFLGYSIDEDLFTQMSPATILAHCLYELTSYSFSDK